MLIKKSMVDAMPAGSVTVDLAAENGGNVETTVPGEVVQVPKAKGSGTVKRLKITQPMEGWVSESNFHEMFQDDSVRRKERWEAVRTFIQNRPENEHRVERLFSDLDSDGSGSVTINEFLAGVHTRPRTRTRTHTHIYAPHSHTHTQTCRAQGVGT